MHQHDGKVLISTFSGENSSFGQAGLDDAWSFVKNVLEKIVPVSAACIYLLITKIAVLHIDSLRSVILHRPCSISSHIIPGWSI